MSEIYRMEREGTVSPLRDGEKCDYYTNPVVDDCRGMICDECARANVSKHCLLATMHANGGSFVSQLALAAQKADPTNYSKLQVAFPEIWDRYAQMFVDAQPNEEAV
tara:strand:- start:458 stop:778 length:321 start_codon:yes stop_codon:yes gene_type:complete